MPITASNSSNVCVITFYIIFLSVFVSQGQCIKCWICHSDADPKCADPFDNSSLPIKDCKEVHLSHLKNDVGGDYERLKDEYYYKHSSPNEAKPTRLPKYKEAKMCRKIRQKIHGNWRTIRSCAFLGSPGEGTGNEHNCLYRQGTHDIYSEYCTCDSKDGCNTGSIVFANLFIFVVLLAISFRSHF